MRFTENKKRKSWILVGVIVILGIILGLSLCQFTPSPKTVQKTIIFEAD